MIEVRLYDTTGLGDYTVLEHATNVAWQDVLSKPGTGSFSLPAVDAVDLLPPRIVKFAYDGVERFAIRLNDESCKVAVDGPRMVDVSGPGLLSLLADAVVWPEYGLNRYSAPDRHFGYMSRVGEWYDPTDWTPSVSSTVLTSYFRWPKFPRAFPDPSAYWIAVGTVINYSWFRTTFTTYADIPVARLCATADDDFEMYLDGERVLSVYGTASMDLFTYSMDVANLKAGEHTLAARISNDHKFGTESLDGELVASLITVLNAPDWVGDVIVNTNPYTWVVRSDLDGGAGWTRAQVVLTLLAEAQARGCAGPLILGTGFTNTADSDGVAWDYAPDPLRPVKGDFNFPIVNTGLDQVVAQFSEWHFDCSVDPTSMELRAWRRRGADLSGTVSLHVAENLRDYETKRSTDVITHLIIRLANGTYMEMDRDLSGLGRREQGVDISSTSDHATAGTTGAHLLDLNSGPQLSMTGQPLLTTGASAYIDYDVGDSISVPGSRGEGMVRARVLAINFAQQGETVQAWPELLHDYST